MSFGIELTINITILSLDLDSTQVIVVFISENSYIMISHLDRVFKFRALNYFVKLWF